MTRRFLCALIAACAVAGGAAAERSIVVQSTTSTQNSGLFDNILPRFTDETGIVVKVVAVGTGQALRNSMNGNGLSSKRCLLLSCKGPPDDGGGSLTSDCLKTPCLERKRDRRPAP